MDQIALGAPTFQPAFPPAGQQGSPTGQSTSPAGQPALAEGSAAPAPPSASAGIGIGGIIGIVVGVVVALLLAGEALLASSLLSSFLPTQKWSMSLVNEPVHAQTEYICICLGGRAPHIGQLPWHLIIA